MAKYIVQATKPLFVETPLWDDQKIGLQPALHVDGRKTVNTGLITTDGSPIMRLQDPIGFGCR